jgi:hypothetical protein
MLCPDEGSDLTPSHRGVWHVLNGDPSGKDPSVPNVDCPSCGLRSYVVAPHSAHPHCPYCDTDLFAAVARPVAPDTEPEHGGDAEAA